MTAVGQPHEEPALRGGARGRAGDEAGDDPARQQCDGLAAQWTSARLSRAPLLAASTMEPNWSWLISTR